jgi:hypothetical protein
MSIWTVLLLVLLCLMAFGALTGAAKGIEHLAIKASHHIDNRPSSPHLKAALLIAIALLVVAWVGVEILKDQVQDIPREQGDRILQQEREEATRRWMERARPAPAILGDESQTNSIGDTTTDLTAQGSAR